MFNKQIGPHQVLYPLKEFVTSTFASSTLSSISTMISSLLGMLRSGAKKINYIYVCISSIIRLRLFFFNLIKLFRLEKFTICVSFHYGHLKIRIPSIQETNCLPPFSNQLCLCYHLETRFKSTHKACYKQSQH